MICTSLVSKSFEGFLILSLRKRIHGQSQVKVKRIANLTSIIHRAFNIGIHFLHRSRGSIPEGRSLSTHYQRHTAGDCSFEIDECGDTC